MTEALIEQLKNPEVLKAIQANPIYKLLNADPVAIQGLQNNPNAIEVIIKQKLNTIGLTDKESAVIVFAYLHGYTLDKVRELTGTNANVIHMCFDNGMSKINNIIGTCDVKQLFKQL